MADFFNRTLDNLRQGPLGPVVRWIEDHPRLSAWIVLGLGMVIMVVLEAQDVGLQPSQWAAIIIATVLVAGACVWIISWEDEDEEPEVKAAETKPKAVMAADAKPAKAAASKKPAAKKTPARKPAAKTIKKSSK
jgi:hypothetical protein